MALIAKILLEEPPRAARARLRRARRARGARRRHAGQGSRGAPRRRRRGRASASPRCRRSADARPSLVPSAGALGGGERRLLAVVMARGAARRQRRDQDDRRRARRPLRAHRRRQHRGRRSSGSGAATDLAAQAARCALAMRAAPVGRPGRARHRPRPPRRRACRSARSSSARCAWCAPVMRADATLVSEKGDTGERAGPSSPTNAVAVRLDETTAGLLDARFDVGGDAEGLALRGERTWSRRRARCSASPRRASGARASSARSAALFAACVDEPQARAVLVTAPAGVGKSRLRYEFLRSSRARREPLEVWMGRGDPMSAGAPFGAARRRPPPRRRPPRRRAARRAPARSCARASPAHVPEADLGRVARLPRRARRHALPRRGRACSCAPRAAIRR